MKKKLAMRIASLALCVVFVGALFGVPKAKAVVTETAIGTAAVASYFQATGLTMAASAGSTGALITTGVADIAGSYAMATGAASSGSAFLSSLAAGVSISPAGALVLTAAAVVAIGALVAWYVGEKGLTEDYSTATVLPGTSAFYFYNGVELPSIYGIWDVVNLPFAVISVYNGSYYFSTCSEPYVYGFSNHLYCTSYPAEYVDYKLTDGVWEYYSSETETSSWVVYGSYDHFWSNTDIGYSGRGSKTLDASEPVPVGDDIQNQLEVTRAPEFTQPDIELDAESPKQMVIDVGLSPGVTHDTVATEVLDLIAAGTLAPTYEITTTETEDGTDTETDPDEETGIYIPILSDIKAALGGLADSITDGFRGLFTPSQESVDGLSTEIDSKLPFIPDLKEFGADLAYNLEHPEECVDDMGFTTVVDLGKGRGSELGNARIDLLDVSWYLEYKPFVDDVIVGFVWLMFLWNLYGELPRIVHGEGSIAKMYGIIKTSGKENDL